MNSPTGPTSKKIGQLFQQANQAHVQGKFENARQGYLEVIKAQPKHFDALHLLGVLCCQLKDFSAAIDYIARAIQISPNPAFYFSRAVAHQELGQLEAAEDDYSQAIKGKPKYPEAYYNLGNLKRSQKNNSQAVTYFDKALSLKPDYADAHFNRGNALKDLLEYDLAVQSFDNAIALNHSYAQAYLNKGIALKEMGQFEGALNCYQSALLINPKYSDAYSNMGILQTELKQWPQAMRSFQEALNLNPQHTQVLWNKSLLLLLHGNFKVGFELYRARWSEGVMISPLLRTQKPWFASHERSPLNNASEPICDRLLIWAEQGIGDEIMFASLLPWASSLAKQILVQTDERLIPLFKRSFPEYTFFAKGVPVGDHAFDFHMPMGQLAEMFCQSLDAFQSIRPCYLISDKIRRDQIKSRIPQNGKPTIGISWRSKNDKKGLARSISATDLVGALSFNGFGGMDVNRFNFINLQYASTQEEINLVRDALGIDLIGFNDIDNYLDIDGLAALIDACDAVVSIDNSTVHLAGALGKTALVLLPFSSDWRWGLNVSESYWYPSVRLYRQTNAGEWAGPLLQLQADLPGLS